MAPLTLESKLCAALASRDERLIRRRLAVPSTPGVAGGPIDFSSNDYLSLSQSADLRAAFLAAANDAPPEAILGSGGSRLLVNPPTHAAFEARCERFFNAPAAILFNSGFDANAGFFSCIPQLGDAMVYDEHIHASVHDGVRASRARNSQFPFAHNNVHALETICRRLLRERQTLRQGESAIFVAVESLYSMDGTFAPLVAYADLLEALFPLGNAYLVVDEAHTTGIYGQQGRGLVCALGLEHRVFARLHTFGKALAGSGGEFFPSIFV
jgi:8-amino-7-oxononanoate synthase